MHASFAVILLAVVPVFAARLSLLPRQFPACSVDCFDEAPTGDCGSFDYFCLCQNDQYISAVTSCLQSSCSGSDLTTAENEAKLLCEDAGVTASPSATGSAGSGSISASGSGSASASGSGSASGFSSSSSGAATDGFSSFSESSPGASQTPSFSIPVVTEPSNSVGSPTSSASDSGSSSGSGSGSGNGLGGLRNGATQGLKVPYTIVLGALVGVLVVL